jgi:hypothetical protein
MASYVSAAQLDIITGEFQNHFDSFKQNIVVNKEPLKTESVSSSNNSVHGYGGRRRTTTSLTPVNETFEGLVNYIEIPKDQTSVQAEIDLPDGDVWVKVKPVAYNYIKDGKKVKNITFDGKTFNIQGRPEVHNFLGQGILYYTYLLKETT